jgi:RND family efflux transporter MFP subunit
MSVNFAPPLFAALALLALPAAAQVTLPAAFPCQVFPSERSEIASPVIGVLAEVLVDRGTRVSRGQPVARLHAEVEETQVMLAQARAEADALLRSRRAKLGLADRTLGRNRDLVQQRVISAADLDQMRTDREVAALDVNAAAEALAIARHELEQARAALAIRTIRSPIDGVVTVRSLWPGEQVRDKPIMTIERIDRLHVELSLPETLYGRVRQGDRATLRFEVPGIAPVQAQVALVDPVVDAGSHTFGLRFVLDNSRLGLPAGIKCQADLAGLQLGG